MKTNEAKQKIKGLLHAKGYDVVFLHNDPKLQHIEIVVADGWNRFVGQYDVSYENNELFVYGMCSNEPLHTMRVLKALKEGKE